jgi:transposase InsO family protein
MRVDPKLIIKTLKDNQDRVRLTARQLGISPGTVSLWRRRAATGHKSLAVRYSTKGLERKSTNPKRRRSTTLSAAQQDRIVALRQARGLGAIKIAATLGMPRSYKTVHRFLKAKGLTSPTHNYRRPRYQETTHMYVKNALVPGKLQMDVKYVTPELSGLPHTCYLYATMDIWSRYKQGVILPLLDQGLAIEALDWIQQRLPFVADFIQTDNGLEFQDRFTTFVKQLGWQHHYIHKSSPNENAVIERSFRTDEEEFFWRLDDAPHDIPALNAAYQDYLKYYNEERLHLGIELKTPMKRLQSVQ